MKAMETWEAFDVLRISASGLSAEQTRMGVIASNIANAAVTRTPDGGPYRRREIVFESVLRDALRRGRPGAARPGGVRVARIAEAGGDFKRIYQPGHPDADANGYVQMPNVDLPLEMVDLITAARAFEANLKVSTIYRRMMERVLNLGK
jgi:flagellar basal-body rod protein FlgC